jgi:hypothetical protein
VMSSMAQIGYAEEEKREREREWRKKPAPVEVRTSDTNWSGVTKSRHLLWHDWWIRGTRQLGRQSRHSRRCDSVKSTRLA